MPAQTETYFSPDKSYRLRVDPRPITSPLGYFSDKVKKREPAGAPKGRRENKAIATVEHQDSAGRWERVWAGPLTNEVAPVDALISNGGDYVVTLDNWHSTGHGSNVVTVHDGRGKLIRALALKDILSADYIEALGHSVSSIQWRGEPNLTPDGNLIIPIIVPSKNENEEKEVYVDAVVRLSDGAVMSGGSPEWQSANAAAQTVVKMKRDDEERAKQEFIAPLLGPKENSEQGWHGYLNEAFYRTSPHWKGDTTSTTVLRDPSDPEYAASEGWMRDALLSLHYAHGTMSFASIAPFDFFMARMKAILSEAKPGSLKGSTVYIAAPASALPMLQAMFAKTGAKVVCHDPEQPIPQRPERLKRYLSRD